MTLCWHVDDMKISHVASDEVTSMIEYLKLKYTSGGIGKMKISRGKVNECLGMILDYKEKGIVKINMIDYVKKMLANFPEDVKIATSPASIILFATQVSYGFNLNPFSSRSPTRFW